MSKELLIARRLGVKSLCSIEVPDGNATLKSH
jgi:hypothetical protein